MPRPLGLHTVARQLGRAAHLATHAKPCEGRRATGARGTARRVEKAETTHVDAALGAHATCDAMAAVARAATTPAGDGNESGGRSRMVCLGRVNRASWASCAVPQPQRRRSRWRGGDAACALCGRARGWGSMRTARRVWLEVDPRVLPRVLRLRQVKQHHLELVDGKQRPIATTTAAARRRV